MSYPSKMESAEISCDLLFWLERLAVGQMGLYDKLAVFQSDRDD
jgi:hypothetical protein